MVAEAASRTTRNPSRTVPFSLRRVHVPPARAAAGRAARGCAPGHHRWPAATPVTPGCSEPPASAHSGPSRNGATTPVRPTRASRSPSLLPPRRPAPRRRGDPLSLPVVDRCHTFLSPPPSAESRLPHRGSARTTRSRTTRSSQSRKRCGRSASRRAFAVAQQSPAMAWPRVVPAKLVLRQLRRPPI